MQRDAAVLLYDNGIAGILVSFISSTFLVFAFTYPDIDSYKKLWWFVMTFILIIRMVDVFWWKHKLQNTEFDGQKAVKNFTIGANITATLWSVYLVYSTTQGNNIELTTTIITISSMAGGSATVLAAHKKSAMFYPFILLTPGSVGLIMTGAYALQLLGLLGITFSIVMLVISKKSADFTNHTLFLKNENAVLVRSMEEKVEQRTKTIYQLSNLDPLTGLYNRTAFLKQLKLEVNKPNTTFALLFIDLDGFKKINDSIGHKAGDQILRKTAERLKQFSPNTQLLCRWGGDEFLIVLADTQEHSAVEQSKYLIEMLSENHLVESSVLSVGATIGITLYPQHATTEDRLIQLADMAMYFQKKQMRSTVGVFSEKIESLYTNELRLKNGLTEAIEKQQLRMVYQPIINAKKIEPSSFEALLRWQFDGDNIPPDVFIPIAEQYGLIHKIGAWVLQNACLQAVSWGVDKQISVCVNVSVIQLLNEHFMTVVEDALNASKLPARLLHIEITESVFASDLNIISNQIKHLQSMGIKVSIDDFGTGYSSLSVMQDLAVNIVKIDRSFVDKMNITSNGDAIISAVMNIASSLNFKVVAEGVETEAQAAELIKIGVHYLQGYYYSKPIEVGEISNYLLKTLAKK